MTPEELIEDMARAMRTRLTVNVLRHAPQVGHGWLNELSVAMAADAHSVVREAMREPSEEMMDAWEKLKHPPHHENRLATKQANIYRAMLAASPLREPKP